MYFKIDHTLRLCIWLAIINLLNVIECRKDNLLTNLKVNYNTINSNSNQANVRKRDAKENANSFESNDINLYRLRNNVNTLSPEAKQSTIDSSNNYFSLYNLLNSARSKRNSPFSSPFNARSSSRNSLIASLAKRASHQSSLSDESAKLNNLNANASTFLSLISDWKKQPTCNELKNLWETSINKLTEYFLNQNNDLYMQPHLNMMNNPIYLALLINLIKDPNLKHSILKSDLHSRPTLDSLARETKLGLDNNQNKENLIISNKQNDQPYRSDLKKNPLTMDYMMTNLMTNKNYDKQGSIYMDEKSGQPYVWQNFKETKPLDSKFIPSPKGRQYQEILDDGPMIIYETDSDNDPAAFWGDAQLSKPVKKPGIY